MVYVLYGSLYVLGGLHLICKCYHNVYTDVASPQYELSDVFQGVFSVRTICHTDCTEKAFLIVGQKMW